MQLSIPPIVDPAIGAAHSPVVRSVRTNVVVERKRAEFQPLVAQLDALSPLAILSRGYAVAWKLPSEELVREAGQLKPEDKLKLQFGTGGVQAIVERVD